MNIRISKILALMDAIGYNNIIKIRSAEVIYNGK